MFVLPYICIGQTRFRGYQLVCRSLDVQIKTKSPQIHLIYQVCDTPIFTKFIEHSQIICCKKVIKMKPWKTSADVWISTLLFCTGAFLLSYQQEQTSLHWALKWLWINHNYIIVQMSFFLCQNTFRYKRRLQFCLFWRGGSLSIRAELSM